jgi:hypothetical protein
MLRFSRYVSIVALATAGFYMGPSIGPHVGSVAAEAPQTSPRPKPRDSHISLASRAAPVRVFYRSTIRPRPRGQSRFFAPEQAAPPVIPDTPASEAPEYVLASTRPVYRSPRPPRRPLNLLTSAKPAHSARVKKPQRVASVTPTTLTASGPLCGDPRIQGEVLAPIPGKLPGCGVAAPVKVFSVDGVILSQPSIMNCPTARTLTGWVSNSVMPTLKRRGGGVKSLTVIAQYACRTRNSKPGAKISEHGKGKAIDISAINFNDGSRLTILDGWKNRFDRRVLKSLHSAACGPFGTVLGPDANKFHEGHFHLDTASYRGGAYCK